MTFVGAPVTPVAVFYFAVFEKTWESLSCSIGFVIANYATLQSELSYPTQHPDERLVVVEPARWLRELAYGEVRLLLAGAPLAEGDAPNLYHRRAVAGTVRPAPHLA